MGYVYMYHNAYIRYNASNMVLRIDNDAEYLVAPISRSRVAEYIHLMNNPKVTKHPRINGAILVEYKK